MARPTELFFALQHDVGYALRVLARSPGFTAAAVLTLALGIGANATMFGIVDRLLLSPPPHVEEPGQVRRVYVERDLLGNGQLITSSYVAYPDYLDWTGGQSLESVAALYTTDMTLGRGQEATSVTATLATSSIFPLLGVQPALGRFFGAADDTEGAAGVVVLSYRIWQREFGGDREVLGQTVQLGQGSYTVIGVAPQGFTGPDLSRVDIWAPLHAFTTERGSSSWKDSRSRYWLRAVIRLRADVAVATAETELTYLHRTGRQELIAEDRYDPTARVLAAPLIEARGPNASGESLVARWLAGVSLVVLLIACANVANLLLARALRRRREIAIRLALGVSRGRLVGQLLTESVILAVIGGVAALLVVVWGAELMRSTLLPDVAWMESAVSPGVLVFTAAAVLAAGFLAGLVPALQASKLDLADALKSGVREGMTRRSKTQSALVLTQGALSVVLLVGAGLFVRSIKSVESIDLGIDPRSVLVANLEMDARPAEADELFAIYQQSLERLQAIPAVEHASIGTAIPFWSMWGVQFAVPGIDSLPRPAGAGPFGNAVSPDFFATLGMRLLRGRGFGPTDTPGSGRVAIINESMARAIWPDADAIGQCMLIGEENPSCTTVVGIVADSHVARVEEDVKWQYFLPLEQRLSGDEDPTLFIRARTDENQLIPVVQRELLSAAPGARYASIRLLQDRIDGQIRSYSLGATMFSVFGLLALIVAGIGLYSVLAFGVGQRTHEIGVRTALGASQTNIVAMVLKEAVGLTAAGIVIGLLIAVAVGGRISGMLHEVSPRDPLVLGIVMLALIAVAVLAGVIPATRAARVNPINALRAD